MRWAFLCEDVNHSSYCYLISVSTQSCKFSDRAWKAPENLAASGALYARDHISHEHNSIGMHVFAEMFLQKLEIGQTKFVGT